MRILVAFMLVLTTGTATANPVRPPKGWKREKLAATEQITTAVTRVLGKVHRVDARWWQGRPRDEYETDDDAGWVMSMQAIVLEPTGTPLQVVDGLVDELRQDFERGGGSPQETATPKLKGVAAAARLIETMTRRTYVQARAKTIRNKFHVLLVVCTAAIDHDDCRTVMKTIKFTPS